MSGQKAPSKNELAVIVADSLYPALVDAGYSEVWSSNLDVTRNVVTVSVRGVTFEVRVTRPRRLNRRTS